ncbi:TPA: hypothetical protein DEP21_06220, partial [Patescibacteria group bacterium]|nr:hypothetical protein [Candidatus Gracilibacteria bacterium]
KKGDREYVGGQKRDIHEADLQHLKDAAEAYKYVAQKYDWVIVDSAPNGQLKTIDEVSDEVWNEVKKML